MICLVYQSKKTLFCMTQCNQRFSEVNIELRIEESS
jgi:hypothetical protein